MGGGSSGGTRAQTTQRQDCTQIAPLAQQCASKRRRLSSETEENEATIVRNLANISASDAKARVSPHRENLIERPFLKGQPNQTERTEIIA